MNSSAHKPAGAPLRVTHLITSLDVGGAERTLLQLATHIDPRRIEQDVICLISIGDIGRQIQAHGVPVTSLGMRPGRPGLRGFLQLIGLLRRGRPHILQTWLYHADLLGLLAGKLAGVPVILWNIRNSDMDFRRYRRLSALVMRTCARLSWLPRAIVVNSRAGQADHARLGYRPRAWKLIPNGVDTRRFQPDPAARAALRSELDVPEGTPLVGMIARYDPMKGHAVFMRAAGEIVRQNPDVRFVLAGLGVDEANPDLGNPIAQYNLAQNATLLGPRPDVERLYPALDLLVSASIFGEGFSNVVVEAMACGVPCVVTEVGDSAWIVGETGAAVPAGDASALARACLRLLSLPADRRLELGRAARQRVLTHFNIDRAVAAYEALYREAAV